MNAPNRSAEVAAWVRSHRWLFAGDGNPDDIRRELLIPLAQDLNAIEGREVWGRLVKSDRTPPFIPHDILMWKDTGQHFDVFTGAEQIENTEASWGENPPPDNPAWIWQSVDGEAPINEPGPPVPVDPPHVDAALTARVEKLEALIPIVNEQKNRIDWLEARVHDLENKPAPAFELPPLRVRGNTSRAFGHGHAIDLLVERV